MRNITYADSGRCSGSDRPGRTVPVSLLWAWSWLAFAVRSCGSSGRLSRSMSGTDVELLDCEEAVQRL